MSTALYAFLASFAVTALAVRLVLAFLRHRQILDLPNERSSHTRPTPRGGGLAVTPVILTGWLLLAGVGVVLSGQLVVMGGALGLLLLSWQDDRKSLPARTRLLVHLLAVVAGIYALPAKELVFQGWLPFWLDRAAAGLLWLWFLNLYNFMDGIDGITASETVTIGLGVALIAIAASDFESGAVLLGLSIAAAALGFLAWNWHPAKLFLGDVGSIPLGFLLGWLLLGLAGTGSWAPALILPLYYLVDATLTLLYRIARFRRFWEAHREHFYQRSVQRGYSHSAVVLRIGAANFSLVALSLLATTWPLISLGLAVVAVVALLVWLMRHPDTASNAAPDPTAVQT